MPSFNPCDWCFGPLTEPIQTVEDTNGVIVAFLCGHCSGMKVQPLSLINENTKKDPKVKKTAIEAKEGFKFGCDPECFILNTNTGEHVSAEGLIPGDKLNPHPVKYGAVQVDGMAAEFNIDPVDNFKDFNRNIQAVINQLTKMLPAGHVLDFIPAVDFKPEIFDASPDKAKELGCSPDFNAWDGGVNPPPADAANLYRRTASGHIHIGWSEGEDLTNDQHIMNCRDLVKQLDWLLGGWSVSVDTDPRRRALYGRAGACRYKTYGVEYRVLSNFWVVSQELRLAVWNRLQIAINSMAKTFFPEAVPEYNNLLLIEGINSSTIPAKLLATYSYPLIEDELKVIPRSPRFGMKKAYSTLDIMPTITATADPISFL